MDIGPAKSNFPKSLILLLLIILPCVSPEAISLKINTPGVHSKKRSKVGPANTIVDKVVDAYMKKSGKLDPRVEPMASMINLRGKSVPRLLQYLERNIPAAYQAKAMLALKFVWSDEATAVVKGILDNPPHKGMRSYALDLLKQHLRQEELLPILKSLGPNDKLAASAFEYLEKYSNDLQRVIKHMSNRKNWKTFRKCLARYNSPKLTPITVKMLDSGSTDEKLSAISALIYQNANQKSVRKKIRKLLLSHPKSSVRDRAAEYLTWHGKKQDLKALEKAKKKAGDLFERASISAAIASINRRKNPDRKHTPPSPIIMENDHCYKDALALAFASSPDPSKAFEFFRNSEASEEFMGNGKMKSKMHQIDSNSYSSIGPRYHARLSLLNFFFSIPAMEEQEESSKNEIELQVTAGLCPPVRKYYNKKRQSFGVRTPSGHRHLGDDVSFYKDNETVVAVGDGIVRVADNQASGLVVIEHKLPNGERFCSFYLHLSPFIHCKVNQKIKKGEKIGSLGRSYTLDNGGYPSHLHLGIHQGPFQSGPSSSDRVGEGRISNRENTWINPQKFLKKWTQRLKREKKKTSDLASQ